MFTLAPPLRASFPLAALVALVLSSPTHADETKEAELRKTLSQMLKKELEERKVELSAEAKEELDKLIERGVEQLAKDKFEDKRIEEAKRNLKKLADALKKASAGKELNGAHIKDVMKKDSQLSPCPLYPFC